MAKPADARDLKSLGATHESSILSPSIMKNSRFDDFVWGIHSHIPECCVLFYCATSMYEIIEYNKNITDIKQGYVPCPNCVELIRFSYARTVVVHKCSAKCILLFDFDSPVRKYLERTYDPMKLPSWESPSQCFKP